MVTAVLDSGSLSTAHLKKALPNSGISEKSISLSVSASILAQFVRDRFLVVCFFIARAFPQSFDLARSIQPLKVWFAQYADDVDSSARPSKDDAIVSRSQTIKTPLVALQFFDSLSIRNGIVCESGAVSDDLGGDFPWKLVEVVLRLLREEDLKSHALFAFRFARLFMYSANGIVRPARMSFSPASIFLRSCGLYASNASSISSSVTGTSMAVGRPWVVTKTVFPLSTVLSISDVLALSSRTFVNFTCPPVVASVATS
jgi:hypothetical protein